MGRKWLIIITFLLLPQIAQAKGNLEISIAKNRVSWKNWEFQAVGLNNDHVYLWDFGDGSLSDAQEPIHAFPKWGKYKVTLSASDSAGGVGAAETGIGISFWHIQNIWLQAILGILALGSAVLVLLIIFNKLPKLKDE